MARKDVLTPFRVATAQSLAAPFTTTPTTVTYTDNCSYQINVTTTNSTGTFFVQGSLDYAIDVTTNTVKNSGTWADLNLSGSPTVNAADDTILIDLNQLPYNAIRLRYASTIAGTGIASVYIMTKQIGG